MLFPLQFHRREQEQREREGDQEANAGGFSYRLDLVRSYFLYYVTVIEKLVVIYSYDSIEVFVVKGESRIS